MFLPDRYVRGTCPRCGALDQYGDSCESCGATYTPADLKDAISVVSGTPPVQRDSEHLFFRLGDFEPMLREWTGSGRLQPAVTAKLGEWFPAGLRDWDISRDAPYFGFEIPGETGKYFYVWLDAPIGYLGSFLQYCRRTGATSTATGSRTATPRSTTSSARTSSTSTRCSGPPCCTARATARRRPSTRTAS